MIVAGGALAGLYAASMAVAGEGLTLGPGYHTVAWAIDPKHSLDLIVAMFFLRALATTATVGAKFATLIRGVVATM